ncbi:MAG: DUF5103 domain-containing protein [Bacteroidales bacterium]|nr:DUF5103 domain-containing protein [Bacteroidales bacterium]
MKGNVTPIFSLISAVSTAMLCIGMACAVKAQSLESVQMKRPDQTFSPDIQSVQLNRKGTTLGDPVIIVSDGIELICSFDDLNAGVKDYQYTFVHCDPWWQPTEGLSREDYLDSYYMEEYIRSYESSYNTLTPYIHYWFAFPSESIKFRLSGNYLLKVYEDDPELPVFTRGFMVIEQEVNIEGRVAKSANPALRPEVQQLLFQVNLGNKHYENPYRNMEVVLSQHDRWDNEIWGKAPYMIRNNTMHFDQEGMYIFKGHNEFRFLDLKSLRYLPQKVAEISVSEGTYYVEVNDREPGKFLSYQYREDINGKYLILSEDARDSDMESEYMNIQLYLPYDKPIAGASLYVTGSFCNWQYLEQNKAIYSPRRGGYLVDLFFKQGYYNYTWAAVELGNLPADATFIDGSFADVQNLYTVRIYYKNPGDYHYRLIGRQVFNSANNF